MNPKDSKGLKFELDFENEAATIQNMANRNNKTPEDNMASSKNTLGWLHGSDFGHIPGAGQAGGLWSQHNACTHGTIKRVKLPRRIKGQLWGAAGAKLGPNDLTANNISMFVPMAGIAFEGAEDFDGFVFGAPMPDFGCWPTERLMGRAKWIAARVLEGHAVCIACHGGHGRTGTLMAAVALCLGVRASFKDPVQWVRDSFCPRAVETDLQAQRVAEVRDRLRKEVR